MRRKRAPVSVHSMRPERSEAVGSGLGANGGEEEARRSSRDWVGPREKPEDEDDIRIEDVEESEQHDSSKNDDGDEDDEDVLDIPETHAPRRVERASRRSAASTPRPSAENDSDAANEPESESVEDIDGNMVIYVSSTLRTIAGT